MVLEQIIKMAILCGLVYLIYKSGIHEKVFKGVNQFVGHTKEFQDAKRVKDKHLRFLRRQRRHNNDI